MALPAKENLCRVGRADTEGPESGAGENRELTPKPPYAPRHP